MSMSSINISQTAMTASQAALSVVSNNIANMNTEGYSKQSIELSAIVLSSNGTALSAAYSGAGVEIEAVKRYTDQYLEQYYRTENSELSYYEELSDISSLVEDSTNELSDTGILSSLSDFYDAIQSLSSDPTSESLRTNFIQTALEVTTKLNETYETLTDLRTSLVGDPDDPNAIDTSTISLSCDEVNEKLAQLAELNENIILLSNQGITPNGLLDQRDQLLNELSEYLPITTTENENGSVNVSLGNVSLVKGSEQVGYLDAIYNPSTDTSEVEDNPAIIQILDSSGNVRVSDANSLIDSGSMGAILEICGSDSTKLTIKGLLDDLNSLASEFADAINSVQLYNSGTEASMCIDSSASTEQLKVATEAIFVNSDTGTTTGITAGNITINEAVLDNPYEIATAIGEIDTLSGTPVPVEPNAVGDNDAILSMAETSSTNLAGLGGSTIKGFLTSVISEMGIKIESINNSYETQDSIVSQIESKLSSATGVSLDEELADLVKYQRAYEASARIFTVSNEILETIVNLGA